MNPSSIGSFLIAFAAFLWATDTLFRYPLMQAGFDPVLLVGLDHLICLCVLLPIAWMKFGKKLTALTRAQWTGLFLIGAGASGFATVFFTASFGLVNPSVAILIQKLQPVFVILFAMLFLKERPQANFWIWSPVAIAAGLVISFPDFNFQFVASLNPQSKGAIYAFIAAFIWALGTVVGKGLVSKVDPGIVTYWRFQFGFATLVALFFLGGGHFGALETITHPHNLQAIGYISLVSGLTAMVIYYQGLKRTTASVATLMELVFPVSAVFLNTIFLDNGLKPVQIAASLILLFAVTQISSQK